jgi:deoxyribodipyrimidine photo-lyase
MFEDFQPTLAAAQARLAAVRPGAYARTRNALDGAVTNLSPYITHGFITLSDVLADVASRHPLDVQHKLVYELGWRAYFRHVWQHRGSAILQSLHEGLLPEGAYLSVLPKDIRQAATGVPVVDQAVQTLYKTGTLHNHARMWLASYVVHMRKVHWRCAADWLYGHLLDGDLASNHLSWQWVAGTASRKPYLFNAENVARYAPAAWHSPGSVVDDSYAQLDHMARQLPSWLHTADGAFPDIGTVEPALLPEPALSLGLTAADANAVAGREVWLVHPWSLGALPAGLPADTVVVGLFLSDFHCAWPWSGARWDFVNARMSALTPLRWWGDAQAIGNALRSARLVRSTDEPHLQPWLSKLAACEAAPALFPAVDRRCDSFSQWWTRTTRGLRTATDLLTVNEVPAW